MSDTMHHRLQGPRIRWQSPEDSPYETITVDKLTPIIGAEIGGVDLARPSNRQMDEIHRALAENCVIFFRDQHLSQQDHLDFGRRFGPLHVHPAAPAEPGHPELMIIRADKDSHYDLVAQVIDGCVRNGITRYSLGTAPAR